MGFDLLSTVEYGGCSAKLSPTELSGILSKLPKSFHENLLVDMDSLDDAGVYKLNENEAIIFTTDFFPPVCSDSYQFGQIAASNALSDIYAMGGRPLLALNLMMFSTSKIPAEAYSDMLLGGDDKIKEAGALLVGGHTIDDHPPKYGLAVVGLVHPDKLISNAQAKVGDQLILTKPLGIGAIIAGQKLNMVSSDQYKAAVDQMLLLNKIGAELMQKYDCKAATDITGFGLAGHTMHMAESSSASMMIDTSALPILPGALNLFEEGCIPGACFRNLEYVESRINYAPSCSYAHKMMTVDAQTSGGLLIAIAPENANDLINELKASGVHPDAAIIGEVIPKGRKDLYFK